MRWATPRPVLVAALAGAGGLAYLAAAVGLPGAILLAAAAALLGYEGARGLLFGAALRADADGVVVVAGIRRRRIPWSRLQGVRATRHRRAASLELDLGDEVLVLPGYRLGAPPDAVATALHRLHADARPGSAAT